MVTPFILGIKQNGNIYMKVFLNVMLWLCLVGTLASCGRSSTHDLNSSRHLFYQHGGVVTVLGDNAISESTSEWGPYEYAHILDSLRKRDFNVISEIRK